MMIKNDNKILDKPLDRIKEFLGYEMEKKLQFYGRFSKGNFDNIQRAVFHNGFLSIAGLGDLKWVFNFDYYGYMDNKRLTRSVVLIHHPSTNKFWIRHKSDSENDSSVLKRTEENILMEHGITGKERSDIIRRESSSVDSKVFLVGRIKRIKRYFVIENPNTTRAYSVSLDKCTYRQCSMSQLEVEYKWIRTEIKKSKKSREKAILKDISDITTAVFASGIGSFFESTTMTKWDWLLKIKRNG